jgi:membrane fusion protein, multidrug efflux system
MIKSICIIAFAALFIVGCGPKSDLDKLKEKKSKLKTELAEIDLAIQALDTTEVSNLPLVGLGKAISQSFHHKISVQGSVETDKDVMINAEMSGIIQKIHIKEGQSVRIGHVLATIDAEILNSNINELENQLEFAEYSLGKQEELRKKDLGTEFEYKQVLNQVNALKAQLETLTKQRNKSVVTAPFDGVIDQIFPKEGEITSPQQPLLRIVNNKDVRITADISERHYRTVGAGSKVKVFVPTLLDTFELQITNVGNYIHPTNRTFRVRADIPNNERMLPNMLAQLIINDLTIDSALVVPATSIMKSQLNEDYLFVAVKNGANYELNKVIVEVLSKQDGFAAILPINGVVKDGDFVVTDGGRGVSDKEIVRTF